MSASSNPTLRWGIIATGPISAWFVGDLVRTRKDSKAHHIVQAIGSSSMGTGRAFASKHIPGPSPTIYGRYDEVYLDPKVDIVYIGTPHAFHKKNSFAITAKETKQVLAAAEAKGVFIMEAMWTRFTPLALTLQKKLHKEKVIGNIRRTFCDFAMEMSIAALGPESRLKNPELGAGSLLDIGIYSLTWALLTLSSGLGEHAEIPKVLAAQTLSDRVDVASSVVLQYPVTGRMGMLTSSTEVNTDSVFCRIEGTEGFVTVEGVAASAPSLFTVYSKENGIARDVVSGDIVKPAGKVYRFPNERGKGFFWEADAVALDIAARRKENAIMPHAETVRVMEMLDEIRWQGGARFPQDEY